MRPAPIFGLLLLILLGGSLKAPESAAQDRSDTGRHAPVKEEKPDPVDLSPASGKETGEQAWLFGGSVGMHGGSDLFRVEVTSGAAVPWDLGNLADFQSARFTTNLDRNFGIGFFLGRRLGRHWSVRADLDYSKMDVAAEALIGQTGGVFLFDRFGVWNLGLGLEVKLAAAESYPFLNIMGILNSLNPDRAKDLQQSNFGGRIGGGFFLRLDEQWGGRLEARYTRVGFAVNDYVPQSSLPDQPEVMVTGEDHLSFFALLLAVQVKL